MAEEHGTLSSISNSDEPSSSRKSRDDVPNQAKVPTFCGFSPSSNGDIQMFPVMYPALVPGLYPVQQGQEQMNRGAGLYAVPTFQYMGPISGIPYNNLIPFTYNIPTGPSHSEAGVVGEEQGQMPQQQEQQAQLPQPAQQRQVVARRFQIAIHLDLLLILKLAAVIFLFNQDGSRQRLIVLMFFASLVYLYQTGALAPLIRWLSQGMQRAAAPPQPPRPAVRAENVAGAGRQGDENADAAGGELRAGVENQPLNDENLPVQNEQMGEPGAGNDGNRWWGIVKEIQMIVFGFITSLLPGFHNID